MHDAGRMVSVGDVALNVVEVGPADGDPILLLHGGPGDDHHEFGDYLHPLASRGYRLLFVDQRAQGVSERGDPATWTLERMAEDVVALGRSLGLGPYAVLGHSYGAFVALQNAVDFPGMAARTIVSAGVPSSAHLAAVEANLARFEPVELRERVTASWAREQEVRTQEEFRQLLVDQLPFHFADPLDPRIAEYERRTAGTVYSPDILRSFSANGYGGIEVQDRLGEVTHPVLVLAGRHDRACSVAAAEAIAAGVADAELVVFESSAHMMFVEEQDRYLDTVDDFLRRHR